MDKMNSSVATFPGFDKRLSRIVFAFLFWTLLAALFTTKSNLYYSFRGISTSWLHLSIHHVAPAWGWLVFMPLIYAFYTKSLTPNRSPLFTITCLLVALPVISVSHRFLTLSADIAFRKYMGYIDGSIWYNLSKSDSIFISGVFDSALICVLILAFFYAQSLWQSRAADTVIGYSEEEHQKTIMVKSSGAFLKLDVTLLIAVSAAGNYIKIQSQDTKPVLIRETMKDFHERLPKEKFIRVNRSCIVNIDFVKSLRSRYNGEYTITLMDETEAHTSRAFGKDWKQILMPETDSSLI